MKRTLIAALIGLAALAAGCSGIKGEATPTPTTGGNATTSAGNASSDLKSIKPCELITDAEAASFGFKLPGETGKIVSADICDWTIPGDGGVQAGVFANDGLKDLNLDTGKKSDTKVGKFAAVKVEAPDGSKDTCDIVISVSETSSVLVLATVKVGSGNTAGACERASKAADLVAAKLP